MTNVWFAKFESRRCPYHVLKALLALVVRGHRVAHLALHHLQSGLARRALSINLLLQTGTACRPRENLRNFLANPEVLFPEFSLARHVPNIEHW